MNVPAEQETVLVTRVRGTAIVQSISTLRIDLVVIEADDDGPKDLRCPRRVNAYVANGEAGTDRYYAENYLGSWSPRKGWWNGSEKLSLGEQRALAPHMKALWDMPP